MPDFANPTGETLSEAQRLRLLDVAAEANIHVIEDAAYQALRFEGDAVSPCLALDIRQCGHIDRSRVIYCGTFSKTLAPGLRTGWACASREVIRKIILIKQAADLHCSTFNQMIIHGVAETLYPRQIGKLVAEYSMRRDAMVKALAAYMPAGVTWSVPQGGMFVWLTLPPFVDAGQLLSDVLRRERIAFVPGPAFYAGRSNRNNLRRSFALQPPPAIDDGIARIARVLHDYSGAAASTPNARTARKESYRFRYLAGTSPAFTRAETQLLERTLRLLSKHRRSWELPPLILKTDACKLHRTPFYTPLKMHLRRHPR